MWFRLPFLGCRARSPEVLFVDDAVPSDLAGQGQPRAALFLASLVELGARVTVLPTLPNQEARTRVRSSVPVSLTRPHRSVVKTFKRYARKADIVIISRPSNMARFSPVWERIRPKGVRLVYDAEAIFAYRETVRQQLLGVDDGIDVGRELENELGIARTADVVLAVNADEAGAFKGANCRDVRVLGYASHYGVAPADFQARQGFLFVGPIYGPETPNGDSIEFFTERVWPAVRQALPGVELTLAGHSHASVPALVDGVVKSGAIEDLGSIYSQARVFIAPTRFAAGIPLKVLDAAAAGIPVVMTSLLATQLGWRNGVEAIVADTPEDFARGCIELYSDREKWLSIRENALARIKTDHTFEKFKDVIRSLI